MGAVPNYKYSTLQTLLQIQFQRQLQTQLTRKYKQNTHSMSNCDSQLWTTPTVEANIDKNMNTKTQAQIETEKYLNIVVMLTKKT